MTYCTDVTTRQMSAERVSDVSEEDLRPSQLMSPPWTDDDDTDADTLRQSASPTNIDDRLPPTLCHSVLVCSA